MRLVKRAESALDDVQETARHINATAEAATVALVAVAAVSLIALILAAVAVTEVRNAQ